MQSAVKNFASPKLIMASPTNHLDRYQDVEKDCGRPVLISRGPCSIVDMELEKDMFRTTPTTPDSSPFPSDSRTTGTKGTDNSNHHRSLKARGVHRQVFPGEGGASQHSGSSSSSLSSLSSPTDHQEPGGVADLTPQPQGEGVGQRSLAGSQDMSHERHMYKYVRVQSAAAVGGGGQVGEWSGVSHPGQPHGHNYTTTTTHEAGSLGQWHGQTGQHADSSWQRHGAVDPRQQAGGSSWQRHEDEPAGQDQPAGQDSSWQRHGRPAGQGLDSAWQGHGVQPTGQRVGAQGQGQHLLAGMQDMQPYAQGQGLYGSGILDLTGQAGGQSMRPYPQGQGEQLYEQGSYSGGQSTRPYPQGQGERLYEQGLYSGGQSMRPYPQGQGESYTEGQSTRPNPSTSAYNTETPASAAMAPHLPSSAMLRTPSYPPSYNPPPDHHQALPPHGNPSSLYHQSSYPHSLPHYQSHRNPAGHDQQEISVDAYGRRPLIAGEWDHQYPFSSFGDTSLGSSQTTPGPAGIPYCYLEGEGSRELLSSYQSSQLSSLGTISEPPSHTYGETQYLNPVRFDAGFNAASYNEEEGERCHSFPLSSYPQHRYDPGGQGAGGTQSQPPYRRVSSYVEEGSKLSRHSSRSQYSTADSLAGEVQRRLVITEDTPAGEDEKEPDMSDTKRALLTMLDSDRIEIEEQPQDLEVEAHQKAVFTCRARAPDAAARETGVKQQWYRGEETMEGEVRADLVFADVERTDAGLYYCVITHPDEESVKKCSYVAQLSIKTGGDGDNTATAAVEGDVQQPKAPVIIEQPPRKIVSVIGEDLMLVLKVIGEHPISFKWYKDTSELNYAQEAVLVIPRATYTDSGQYCCSVSNHHGSQLSESFNVQVSRVRTQDGDKASAGINQKQRPQSLHNWEGSVISDVFLKEVALVVAQQVSNWQKLVSYLGLNHSDLMEIRSRSQLPVDHALGLLYRWRGRYRESKELLRKRLERAGLDFDTLTSSIPGGQVQGMEHRVIAKPTIVIQPQSQQVIYGQEFSLSVEVERPTNQKCVLQWYKNYVRLHGKTDHRLTVKSAVDSDAGEYYCMAANKGGTIDSDIAFVRIINPHPTPAVGVVNPHPTPAAGVVNPHAPRHTSTAGIVNPHAPRHSSTAGDHQAPDVAMLSSWSGQGSAEMPAAGHWQSTSVGGPGTFHTSMTGVGSMRHEDLIGRGFLDDTQPTSLTSSMEGRFGGGAGGSGFSSLRFTSRRGSGTTSIAADSDIEKPRIVRQPESQAVEAGDPLTLTCEAIGSGELTYLWYFNGLSLQREERSEYFINCFTDEDEGDYYCRVANAAGEVDTNIAHVEMKDD